MFSKGASDQKEAMILSVSRRTDIPNYYSEWFFNRIKEGFVYVRNPMNPRQVSRIELSPEVVDCIVFWTKNPAGMLDRLEALQDYAYYFHFTLTGYGKDVEPNLPDKRTELIPAFIKLSEKIGKEKVIWRYDPILINSRYTLQYHRKAFAEIAERLQYHTEKVVISFVDLYAKTLRNTRNLQLQNLRAEEMLELAKYLAEIASQKGLVIESCAEAIDLEQAGIRHGSCIGKELTERIVGCKLQTGKTGSLRTGCGCIESVEIGAYNTCLNGCKYCYANYNEEKVRESAALYDVNAPILCGRLHKEDQITERKMRSLKDMQISLL